MKRKLLLILALAGFGLSMECREATSPSDYQIVDCEGKCMVAQFELVILAMHGGFMMNLLFCRRHGKVDKRVSLFLFFL